MNHTPVSCHPSQGYRGVCLPFFFFEAYPYYSILNTPLTKRGLNVDEDDEVRQMQAPTSNYLFSGDHMNLYMTYLNFFIVVVSV